MAEERIHRRLAAILAADVVGYSRLMQLDEGSTYDRLRAHRTELFEPTIAEHGGRVFKLMGDGLLAEFDSVVDAVECAASLQQAMAGRNQAVADDRRIDMRMGIHVGDVIVEGTDRHGDAVNLAARLQELAEPGGICVSRAVVDQSSRKSAVGFEFRGEERLKNLSGVVAVYRVTRNDAPLRSPPTATARLALPLPDKPSVAVLPFANLTGEASRDFLVDGVTESIITELSRDRALFVIARNSTFFYKGKPVEIAKIAEEFGVRYVVEGSVQGNPDRLRVNARLVDAFSGRNVWSGHLDGNPKDIFAFQDHVTRGVVATLRGYKGALQSAELTRATRKADIELDAYENLLRGMTHKEKFAKDEMALARQYFERAIELAPHAAEAHGWLAWTHFFDAYMGWSDDPGVSLEKTFAAAHTCVGLDPQLDYGHWVLGSAYLMAGQIDRSLGEYGQALELNPNNSDVLATTPWVLVFAGRASEALDNARMAIRLNPLHPDWYLWGLGVAYYGAGRFREAVEALERMKDPNTESLAYSAASYTALGESDQAKARSRAILALEPGFTLAAFAERLGPAAPAAFRDEFLARLGGAELPP